MMTTTFAYRDDAEGAAIRHADLLSRRASEDRALADAQRAHGRRVARIAAGVTGIAGAAAMAVATAAVFLGRNLVEWGVPTAILIGTWPVMGLVYIAARTAFWRRGGERLSPATRGRDLHAAIARLEQAVPIEEERARAARLERGSVAFPLIAVALLGPLTLHALFYMSAMRGRMAYFDAWIAGSLVIVGHAHLVLAWMSHRFAKGMESSKSSDVLATWSPDAWRAYGYTVLASAIPGIVLYLLPPILTAITGVLAVPLAFRAAAVAVVTERRLLGAEV